jgi:hypothetical protein
MRTAAFWTGAFDRAIKSLAQTLILLWFTSDVVNIFEVNWVESLGVGAGALVLSLLTSIVSAPIGDDGTTSMLRGGN